MSTYNAIAWLPLCAGLTGIGLVASWFAMRKRGLMSGLRGAAWSLLPLAAYLTGSIEMFWKIGTAIGTFATSFAFSLKVWSGVGVAALAAVLFLVSATGRRRKRRRSRGQDAVQDQPGRDGTGGRDITAARNGAKDAPRKEVATKPARAGKGVPDDDDMAGVEDILRRHGIT
jgi:membrane protein implicated in regulation of membrane protease activity